MRVAAPQRLASAVRAGLAYFAVVFATGFVFGTMRTLWLVPLLGERTAELLETPLMLAVIYLTARWIVRRFGLRQSSLPIRAAVGAVALILLVGAEIAVVLSLRGLTLADYIRSRDPVSGTAYVVSLLIFAAMPAVLGTGRRD
jgi:hypothetical protein